MSYTIEIKLKDLLPQLLEAVDELDWQSLDEAHEFESFHENFLKETVNLSGEEKYDKYDFDKADKILTRLVKHGLKFIATKL